jgi:hypothetical protein
VWTVWSGGYGRQRQSQRIVYESTVFPRPNNQRTQRNCAQHDRDACRRLRILWFSSPYHEVLPRYVGAFTTAHYAPPISTLLSHSYKLYLSTSTRHNQHRFRHHHHQNEVLRRPPRHGPLPARRVRKELPTCPPPCGPLHP